MRYTWFVMGTNRRTQRRRLRLLSLLERSDEPISGTTLGRRLGTSRQIIVQDIAILRAAGHPILSTPRGYLMWRQDALRGARASVHRTSIVSKHGKEECEDELMALVDLGVKVVDVIVEHPIYGEIRRPLMIQSPQDVREFMEKLHKSRAQLLCELTDGIHRHTLEAPRADLLERARQVMDSRGYLVK